jgi:hypothetical protein
LAGLLAASASIANHINLKTWMARKVNLFMVIVGQPGDAKTQALKFCFNPIQIKESQLFADYENQLAEYEKKQFRKLRK